MGREELLRAYRDVPYLSQPVAEMQPGRLHALATLFGLDPAEAQTCRILELGCGDGTNLLATACNLPEADCLGIDLSPENIKRAQAGVRSLGLENIRFIRADLAALPDDLGSFDYVVCHGLFSWIPRSLQDRLLEVFRTHLRPHGVGYLSYNTYPGWHSRRMTRQMMRFAMHDADDPATQVAACRALVGFVAEHAVGESPVYQALVRRQHKEVDSASDFRLYHDFLETWNEPIYFEKFVEAAREQGLSYLTDAQYSSTLTEHMLPESAAHALKELEDDAIRREQLLDFLTERTFRRSLVFRSDLKDKQPELAADNLSELECSACLSPVAEGPVDLRTREPLRFTDSQGADLVVCEPAVKTAFVILRQHWPRSVPFRELRKVLDPLLTPETRPGLLEEALLDAFARQAIDLHGRPQRCASQVSECPVASPFARYCVGLKRDVINLRCERVELPHLARALLPLLDGSRNRAAFLTLLVELGLDGTLAVAGEDGKAISDPEQLGRLFANALEPALATIARSGLLVA